MDLDDIKRGLRAEIKKRENEQYATFQCNVRQMCKDVLAKLEEQEAEIAELKAENERLNNALDKERSETIKYMDELCNAKNEIERLTIDKRNAELRADVADATVEKLKGFLFKIIDEHKVACRKHPDFVSAIIDPSSRVSWAESEARIKLRNSRGPQCADNILMEEVAEALNAYQQGDKEHALQELAQCGAVILRIMETIEKEIVNQ